MYKIKILSIGKVKEPWLQEALEEYEKRLSNRMQIEWVLPKNDEQLERLLEKQPHFFALTPEGKQYTSLEFSAALISWLTSFDSRLVFVIGGAEGIPQSIKSKAEGLISISKMTFTHQATRLILLEQIYRAIEISIGSKYNK